MLPIRTLWIVNYSHAMRASGGIGDGALGRPDSDMRERLLLTLRCLAADRRGVTAVMFAASAAILIGFVGLAAEGGTWYLEKRHGQNAADAAVTAAALALADGQNPAVSAIAAATGTGAGYTSGNVTITAGSFNAGSRTFTANAAPANAVQAVVTATRVPLFAALFIGRERLTISSSAVAMLAATGPACILGGSSAAGAGAGSVTFDVTASVQATGCAVASNGSRAGAITGATATAVGANQSLVSAGGCAGCSGTSPLTYQPQTPDPLARTIGAFAGLPTKAGTQCNGNNAAPIRYGSTTPPTINCNGLAISGNTVDLAPGTYVFFDSGIAFNSGSITCTACTGSGNSGVTIIMTGTNPASIGTINVGGSGKIDLVAPATNDFNAVFNAVLFYTDTTAAMGNIVTINGSQTATLGGIMYFPASTVTFGGNGGGRAQTCSEIIAANMTFSGASAFNISGCPPGTVPWTQSVRLVK